MWHHILFHRKRRPPNFPLRRGIGWLVLIGGLIGMALYGCEPQAGSNYPTYPTAPIASVTP